MASFKNTTDWHKELKEDPFARIVEKNLKNILKKSSAEKVMSELARMHKPYKTVNSFGTSINRGTYTTRDFIKFMLAAGIRKYTIEITDEELEQIETFLEKKEK